MQFAGQERGPNLIVRAIRYLNYVHAMAPMEVTLDGSMTCYMF